MWKIYNQYVDKDRIARCISLVGLKGTPADICVLYTRLSDNLQDHVIEFEMASRQYLSELIEMINKGAFPFKFNRRYPRSVLYTATGLNILFETKLVDRKILDQVIACLLAWQDTKGWWKDTTDLLEVNNLPFYQDPMEASVRIFNTASVGSVLIKFSERVDVKQAIDKAIGVLKTAISSNGSLIGFPQSTVYATPLFAKYYGLESEEFQRHLKVLELMIISSPITADVVTIGEQLFLAGLSNSHPIITSCRDYLDQDYSEAVQGGNKIGGWKSMKQFDPSLSMRALLFLIESK